MYYQSHNLVSSIREAFKVFIQGKSDINADIIEEFMLEEMSEVGIDIVHLAFDKEDTDEYYDIETISVFNDDNEVDFSILEAVGLVRRVDSSFIDVGGWSLAFHYHHVTPLGFYFAKSCGMVDDLSAVDGGFDLPE